MRLILAFTLVLAATVAAGATIPQPSPQSSPNPRTLLNPVQAFSGLHCQMPPSRLPRLCARVRLRLRPRAVATTLSQIYPPSVVSRLRLGRRATPRSRSKCGSRSPGGMENFWPWAAADGAERSTIRGSAMHLAGATRPAQPTMVTRAREAHLCWGIRKSLLTLPTALNTK